MKNKECLKKPNFIELFKKTDEREKWIGDSGYICTYSAEEKVLEKVIETFNNGAKRRNVIHLIVGTGCEKFFDHISLLGLDPKKDTKRTLHAKVCLLKFKSKNSTEVCYRVIVTTGNLTRNSLMNDWDLYWYNDLVIDTNDSKSRKFPLERANILAAKEFFEKLLEYYPESFVSKLGVDSKKIDFDFNEFVKELEKVPRGRNSQFIHSIENPLIGQITRKANNLTKNVGLHPYLLVGSGFYGDKNGAESIPDSLIRTVEEFQKKVFQDRLKSCYVAYSHQLKAIVEEKSPNIWRGNGNVVKAVSSGLDFLICPVRKDEKKKKTKNLHAKFIFGSFNGPSKAENRRPLFRENFLYLGSGNITTKGLFQRESNIEAGVFIDLTQNTFGFANTSNKNNIEDFLPFDSFGNWQQTLEAEEVVTENIDKGRYVACPVQYLKLTKEKKIQVLHHVNDYGFDFQFQFPINRKWNPKNGDFLELKNVDDEELRDLITVPLTWSWKEGEVIHTQTEPILIIDENGELRANHRVKDFDEKDPFACTVRDIKKEKENNASGGNDFSDDSESTEEEENDYAGTRVKDTDLRTAMRYFESLFRAYLWKIDNDKEDWDVWLSYCKDIVEHNLKNFEALKKYHVNPFLLLLRKEQLSEIDEGTRNKINKFVEDVGCVLDINKFQFIGCDNKGN